LLLVIGLAVAPALRAADPPRPAEIERLIRKLGSDDFKEREQASKRIEELAKQPSKPCARRPRTATCWKSA
jgi:hypothetical protein